MRGLAWVGLSALLAVARISPSAPAADPQWVPFVRGDATASGTIDLSDGIAILLHLFSGVDLPPCVEAANANGDKALDLADAVFLFSHLFLGAPPPPAPHPECGFAAPENRAFSCEAFEPCSSQEPLEIDRRAAAAELEVASAEADGAKVGPELFDALLHLAMGESVLALRGLPGFEEYSAQSEALARNRASGWDEARYSPAVRIDAVSPAAPPCLKISRAILGAIGDELRSAGAIAQDAHVTGAFPETMCGEGTTPVLLRLESESWKAYIGCDANLRSSSEEPEGISISISPQALGRAASLDPVSGSQVHCELTTTGIVVNPAAVETDQMERSWDLFGSVRERKASFSYGEKGADARNDGWDLRNGPGPRHYLLAERSRANCLAPATTISESRGGSFSFQVQILCYADGKRAQPPQGCTANTTLTGIYRSGVAVQTHAGLGCFPLGANRVEALAKDETCLTVQDAEGAQVLFSKGALVQNGNKVTSQVTFDLRGNLCYKPGEGPSGDATASFGYSQTTEHTTGSRADAIEAYGFGSARVPAQGTLTGTGTVTVNGYRRTIARAAVEPRAVGLAFVATSDCPGTRPVAGAEIIAVPGDMDDLRAEFSAFFEVCGVQVTWTDEESLD